MSRFGSVLCMFAAALLASPAWATDADDLCAPTDDPCTVSTTVAIESGSTIDVGARELRIASGGTLDLGIGEMDLVADRLVIQAGGRIDAHQDNATPGGAVNIEVNRFDHQGSIDAAGSFGGDVNITASGPVDLSGPIDVSANQAQRSGGGVTITAGSLTIAAMIDLTASDVGGSLSIEVQGPVNITGTIEGTGEVGGDVSIFAEGGAGTEINLTGGTIRLRGSAAGGTVSISSSGPCNLDGTLDLSGTSGAGSGGEADIRGSEISVGSDITARGGSQDFGGAVSLTATGDINIGATLDVSAAEGGELAVTVGDADGAGNFVLAESATLRANATAGGGFGGGIDITATGDAISTGNVDLLGDIIANGAEGTFDTGGGDGGVITVTVDGAINDPSGGGRIRAAGGAPDGTGGQLTLDTVGGGITYRGPIEAFATASETSGGFIEINAGGPVLLTGVVDGRGGGFDGGSVLVESQGGGILIESNLEASSTGGGGSGGEVSLSARSTPGEQDGTVVVLGLIRANGSGSSFFAGDGGILTFEGDDGVRLAGNILASGGSGGGSGGDMRVTSTGLVDLEGVIRMNAQGGQGGSLDISAGPGVTLGVIEALGQGFPGGAVFARATGPVSLTGAIDLRANGAGSGGTLTILTDGDITVSANVTTNGGGQATRGGMVRLEGCRTTVQSGVTLTSNGPDGLNKIQGQDGVTVAGRAIATGGRNEVRTRSGILPNLNDAFFNPAVTTISDSNIVPCGVVTPTPTRTNTRTPSPTRTPRTPFPTDTPTATPTMGSPTVGPSATPTPTATVTRTPGDCVGDCNGDGQVTINELVLGVGIALGSQPVDACPAFDANGDGQVTINELVSGVSSALNGCP